MARLMCERAWSKSRSPRAAAPWASSSLAGVLPQRNQNGPERVLRHLVGHGIGIFQPQGKGGDAALSANQRKGQCGHLAGIAIPAGEQRRNLIGVPSAFEVAEQPFEVFGLKQRLDRSHKVHGINAY